MSMTDMSGMNMATATSSMAMASSTASAGHDMSGMASTSSMMGMSDMTMTFFSSNTTPLYSMTWTPANMGQYAGTCLFLIAFALVFRVLIALRCNFTPLWVQWTRHETPMGAYRVDENLLKGARRPWRVNEAAARATLDTMLAGVSYLLMIAVMTMNVGYFLSVLGGTFLGSFALGSWGAAAAQ
ncbi:hypothetical protein B0A48_17410 [Cryoendolithus antarcticus]|uniref:Copper transport protein n=1 Tax=Cryoendolithus antarcticus TaxID=1507870 RepID=A0A1V8SCJ1_9PEZI|nr:hypothetical protein B0A48_17410 [Cryoendolithus antarcticus]